MEHRRPPDRESSPESDIPRRLIGDALDDIHLIDKNLILAAETAEFAQIGGAQNLAFTVIEQVFVHDLEDIHAGIPHKVHVRLDGRVAVVHLLREMEPEARGNPSTGLPSNTR